MLHWLLVLIKWALIFILYIFGTEKLHAQSIQGKVIDYISLEPLQGAHVTVLDTNDSLGTVTDLEGKFEIQLIASGVFSFRIQYLGFETKIVPDVGVYPNQTPHLVIKLIPGTSNLENVSIVAYQDPTQPTNKFSYTSSRGISVQEASRFAGSLGDPSRMALSYAGVASSRGDRNDIIVRGNSAKYLKWRLEGIEIPNPNHFGLYGSSGGLLNILNNQNLSRSNFYLGAVPPEIGNSISGVFDLYIKKGNRNEHKHYVELGLIGLSFGSQGPIKKGKEASYNANYRYSTLGLIKRLDLVYQAPDFQDLSFNINLPTDHFGNFLFYGIVGDGTWLEQDFFREIDSTIVKQGPGGKEIYGFSEISADNLNEYTLQIYGAKHQIKLGNKSLFTSHLNYSSQKSEFEITSKQAGSFETFFKEGGMSSTRSLKYQPVFEFISGIQSIKFGGVFTYKNFDTDISSGDESGNISDITDVSKSSLLGESFLAYQNYRNSKYRLTTGLHLSYFSLNKQFVLDPRLGFKFYTGSASSIGFDTGLYSATETPEVYVQLSDVYNTNKQNLRMSRSWQSVLNYKRAISSNLYLTSEIYYQYLFDIPVARDSVNFSLINEEISLTHFELINDGIGVNYGLEVTLEKVFSKSYYFLLTSSLFQSEYRYRNNLYRKSKYSEAFVANFLIGKEFSKNDKQFGVNLRSTISGGKPYIPIDREESFSKNREVRDNERAYLQKLPPFLGIDISFYRRWEKATVTHEIKLDIFRVFEINYQDEIFLPRYVDTEGEINKASVKKLKYGDGSSEGNVLPVLYYKMSF